MIVFLDFDGVVHPQGHASRASAFCRLPLIEEVFREFAVVSIVISSAWRMRYQDADGALLDLRQYFSPDIAERVVGVTPWLVNSKAKLGRGLKGEKGSKDLKSGLARYPRQRECEAWMQANRPSGCRWMAMDDRAGLFAPSSKNLMAFDLNEAFTYRHKDKLREFLNALVNGTDWLSL